MAIEKMYIGCCPTSEKPEVKTAFGCRKQCLRYRAQLMELFPEWKSLGMRFIITGSAWPKVEIEFDWDNNVQMDFVGHMIDNLPKYWKD